MNRLDTPLRVLQVVDSLGMGGAETWLLEALRRWSKTGGVKMDFLLTGCRQGVFDEEAARLGARLYRIRYGLRNAGAFARSFRDLLRREKYDAIHDHADYASGWHFFFGAGRLPRIRVAHVHNPRLHITDNYGVTPRRRATAAAGRRLVYLLATDVCGTSAAALKEYGFTGAAGTKPRIRVLHCGINVSKFCGPREPDRRDVEAEFGFPSDAKIILFAGRLDRALEFDHPQNHKNSWLAIHVAREALRRDSSIRLLMAGDGADSGRRLERQIAEWGFSAQLKLIGIRTDIPRLMRAADALLFPSRQEGLGMAAVEAQASGLPVLASAAVPRECVVVDNLYASLPLKAPLETWAEKLIETAKKPRLPADACLRAFENSDFSIERSTEKLEKLYRGAS